MIAVLLAVTTGCVLIFVLGLRIGVESTKVKTYPIIIYDESRVNQGEVETFVEDGFGALGVRGDPRTCVMIINS